MNISDLESNFYFLTKFLQSFVKYFIKRKYQYIPLIIGQQISILGFTNDRESFAFEEAAP